MKRQHGTLYSVLCTTLVTSCVLFLAGCVVRTYQVTKDRVDQDVASGNRGFLMGRSSESAAMPEKKTTRTIQAVEIELHPPVKFEKMPKTKSVETEPSVKEGTDEEAWGNRGYITESVSPEPMEAEITGQLEKYTVQKNDTLQKISRRFYGTTKKWNKIYQANKAVLKGPDKIYPGQVIDIPVEAAVKEGKKKIK